MIDESTNVQLVLSTEDTAHRYFFILTYTVITVLVHTIFNLAILTSVMMEANYIVSLLTRVCSFMNEVQYHLPYCHYKLQTDHNFLPF